MPTLEVLHRSRPAILAHRGASAHAADNSRRAFELAAEMGADGVELDVRRTADGALVVHHDPTIAGLGPLVACTREDLKSGAPDLLSFDEAMAACGDLVVNIEIKNAPGEPDFDPDDTVAYQVAQWIAVHDAYERVLVSSFTPHTARAVRAADPDIATGLLVGGGADLDASLAAARAAGHRSLHPHHSDLDPATTGPLVTTAAAAGMVIVTWTVDDPGEQRRLAAAGIAGLIVNDPAAARRTLATG